MLARIETLMDGMRLVTDSLAHDLRSPLTRAKGAIEMALRRPAQSDGNDVEGYRQALEQTATELETILRTFESLINIAQEEAGLNRLTMRALELLALAKDLMEVYQPIDVEAGMELTGASANGGLISGHSQLMGRARANKPDNTE